MEEGEDMQRKAWIPAPWGWLWLIQAMVLLSRGHDRQLGSRFGVCER